MQKISTICSSYKSYGKIHILIDSFDEQKYDNKELIIVDGSNKKEDFDIIAKEFCNRKFIKFFYFPNKTIYECLNKGISESNGTIINIMGDNDFFFNSNTFCEVGNEFNKGIDLFYGDTMFKKNEEIVRYYKSFEIKKGFIKIAFIPSHTSSFISKNLYDKIGVYNTSYKIASDLDFYFRLLKEKNLKYIYKKRPITIMTHGGKSNKSLNNVYQSNLEAITIMKKNNLKFPLMRVLLKLLIKLFLLINFKLRNNLNSND